MKRHNSTPRIFALASLFLVAGVTSFINPAATVPMAEASNSVSLEFVGRADSGVGNAGSEIVAFDPKSKNMFVTNGNTNQIDVFSIANPASPVLKTRVNLAPLGVTGIQSVASRNGLVATVASVGGNNQAAGKLFVMNADGVIDSRAPQGVTVGSLPDSVHFTPDGRYILSANEGEPRDYCLTDGALPTTTDPFGSVSIVDTQSTTLAVTTLDFSAFNTKAADIRTAGGRVYGPGASVAQDLEPEYIAISPDSKRAFVTLQENNSVAEIDIAAKKIVRVMGLGYKDHAVAGNALDPSDRDSATNGGLNIGNWPVKGMFQPDAIAAFTDQYGNEYFATANEGDAREYKCLLGGASTGSAQAEDERVATIGVDGTNVASSVTDNAKLGRLGVTRFFPATYTNSGNEKSAASATDFTSLYTLGARSLTIWRSKGGTLDVTSAELVADTGDLIEKKIAELLPNYFNGDWNTSTGTPNAKDTRSDNKGPEPEGLAIGKAFGRTLAFVGLERVGGVMTFDITNPAAPTYVSYNNSSVFTGVAGANFTKAGALAGDVSPEGLLFVKATDSPIGVPLLMVAHELSGTTAIYKVLGTPAKAAAPIAATSVRSGNNATITWQTAEDDGGSPATEYVVTSRPAGKNCKTTATSCVIKNLQPGVEYVFTVKARNSVGLGGASSETDAISRPFFTSSAGRKIALKNRPSALHSTSSEISVSKRKISVGLVTPVAKNPSNQVMRYAVQLFNANGEAVETLRMSAIEGKSSVTTIQAPAAGKYRVVVTAGLRIGKKIVWNSPVFSVS